MKSQRAVLLKPEDIVVKEFDIAPQKGQILIKTYACGLCNWELNHWKGTYGTYPQGVGHEWCGRVVEVGEGVENFKAGDKVTALPYASTPGFADYIVSDADKCFLIDPEIPLINAMAEPQKCVVTVLRGADAKAGDWVTVVGCGPMGIWCIQGLKGNQLAGIIAVDFDEKKLALAKKYGATYCINPKTVDAREEIEKITHGNMSDVVIEGTGIPEVLNDCCRYAAKKGRVCLMSSHERTCKEFDFREVIAKGLTIVGTHPPYSEDELEDTRRAVSLINSGAFDSAELVNYRFELKDIKEAFETLQNKPKDYIKGCVFFGEEEDD